jgi:hypothetical protein
MIEKEVKEYKQGNKIIQRINLLKSDNLEKDQKIIILTDREFTIYNDNAEYYRNRINELEDTLNLKENRIKELINESFKSTESITHDYEKEIGLLELELKTEKEKLKKEMKTQKHYDSIFNKLGKYYDKNIKEIDSNSTTLFKELDKQHNNQVKKLYNELSKYKSVYSLQNKALKEIFEMGYLDSLLNKNKKIAKENINQIEGKETIEFVPKELMEEKINNEKEKIGKTLSEIRENINKIQR